MNEESKAVYRSYLKHSAKGQSWGKHKYIAIKNGRYIYPEDLKKGGTSSQVKYKTPDGRPIGNSARAKYLSEHMGKKEERRGMITTGSSKQIEAAKRQAQLNTREFFKDGPGVAGTDAMAKAMEDTKRRKQMSSPEYRSRQINDQIKSAHSNATSSKMDLTPGSELKKKAEERKAANTNSTTKTKEQEIAEQIKRNNSGTISEKKEESKKEESKKEEPTTTATTTNTTETTTDKKKSGSGKGGGKIGSSSKKSSKKEDAAKTEQTTTPVSASEEAKALGLSDDDIKLLDSNIDLNATDRDTVIRNLALRVIKGDFGNGADRKEKLGKYYTEIQKKVNELMKELKSSKSSTEAKHSIPYAFDTLRSRGGRIGVLAHAGVKFRSGRYKYGSGDRPHQHDGRGGSVRDMSDDDLKKAIARKGLERQYNKMYKRDRLSDAKEVVDATSNAINRVNNKNREKLNRRPQRERMNLEGMTDKELRDRINRELLEKQYSDLFGKEKNTISDGERKAAEILDVTGDVLGVTSSALLIALSIKKLMGK